MRIKRFLDKNGSTMATKLLSEKEYREKAERKYPWVIAFLIVGLLIIGDQVFDDGRFANYLTNSQVEEVSHG